MFSFSGCPDFISGIILENHVNALDVHDMCHTLWGGATRLSHGRRKRRLKVLKPYEVLEGAGVLVKRAIPSAQVPYDQVDPFLLFDLATIHPEDPGFPNHPHRGFEIVTYVLSGSATHSDSLGHRTTIRTGGVQKITAGRGIVHREGRTENSPSSVQGVQLWVNLPRKHKLVEPDYQTLLPHEVPVINHRRVTIRQIVGGPSLLKLHTNFIYLDVRVIDHGTFEFEIPSNHQGFLFVVAGVGLVGNQQAAPGAGHFALLNSKLLPVLRVTEKGGGELRFLLLIGRPHREPIHWNGPYVD